MKTTSVPWVIAAAVGLSVALGISALTGRAEAWDHDSYFSVGYPIFAVSSLALGWVFPERPWRWPMTMMAVQAFPLTLSGSDLSLAPLGAMFLVMLSLPLCVMAQVSSVLRKSRA